MLLENTVGASCTRSISGCTAADIASTRSISRFCNTCLGCFRARSVSGFATAVDTPCASSILGSAGTASTGSIIISSVEGVRTASIRSAIILPVWPVHLTY